MVESKPKSTFGRRRWLQFGLRTMLIAMTGFCILLGGFVYRWNRAKRQAVLVARISGNVYHEYESTWSGPPPNQRRFDSFLPESIRTFLGEDFFRDVEVVEYFRSYTDDDKARVREILTTFPRLQSLELEPEFLDDENLRLLALQTSLKKLEFRWDGPNDEQLGALSGLTSLEHLSLGGGRITDRGMNKLKGLVNLRHLNLRETQVGNLGAEWIKNFPKLEHLYLSETAIDDSAMAHIGQLRDLTELSLSDTGIGDTGMGRLESLRDVRSLDLSRTRVTDQSMFHMKQMKRLEFFYIVDTNIIGSGFQWLLPNDSLRLLKCNGSPILDSEWHWIEDYQQLSDLWVPRTALSDAGLKDCRWPPKLSILVLDETCLTDASIPALCKCRMLTGVRISRGMFTPDGEASLRSGMPKGCKLGFSQNN